MWGGGGRLAGRVPLCTVNARALEALFAMNLSVQAVQPASQPAALLFADSNTFRRLELCNEGGWLGCTWRVYQKGSKEVLVCWGAS